MRRADFGYELPPGLIAQQPLAERSASRMLVLDGAGAPLRDCGIRDLPALLAPGDLLVFNDTRVLPARVRGRKQSGGACELLLERILGPRRFLAQARASKPFRRGTVVTLPGDARATVSGLADGFVEFELDRDVSGYFESCGSMPLPPYIARPADASDRERYQTVYAATPGAVAAPTAGLHFDQPLLAALQDRGIGSAMLTLHVGAGTFQPPRVDDLAQHRMHRERLSVPAATVEAIAAARAGGGRVVAVGTTVVRGLETAAAGGRLEPFEGDTGIFILPGHHFRAVDAMLTNFHLPESTLLMLVSAFAGRERVLDAYHHAVSMGYRFYSYGDAMFITPDSAALAAAGA